MWFKIFDKKPVAPSIGDFADSRHCGRPVDKISNKKFSKLLVR